MHNEYLIELSGPIDTYITPLKYILNEYSFTFYYQIIFYILDHFHTKNTKLYAQTRSACVLQVNVFNWGFFSVCPPSCFITPV